MARRAQVDINITGMKIGSQLRNMKSLKLPVSNLSVYWLLVHWPMTWAVINTPYNISYYLYLLNKIECDYDFMSD